MASMKIVVLWFHASSKYNRGMAYRAEVANLNRDNVLGESGHFSPEFPANIHVHTKSIDLLSLKASSTPRDMCDGRYSS